MAKASIAIAVAAVGLGAVALAQEMAAQEMGIRNLLLKAAGRDAVPPGSIRIPIPADGAEYEVIIVAPGEPRLVHL